MRQTITNAIDKLLLAGSIDENTDSVLSSSSDAGGDLLARYNSLSADSIKSQLDAESVVYRLAEKPKYIPGGKGFFETVGVKGLPSQQMDPEESTPGASSSSEPVERRNPLDLIPVGVHVDNSKTPPGLETVVETKEEEELPEADWEEVDPNMPILSDINSDDEHFQSALGETIEQECENCGFMNSLLDFYCSS